jgi:citrate lyase subunit beta/citryl-CoA lyase
MLTKSATLAADAVILDLEDAVPILEKETARIMIRDAIAAIKQEGSSVFVRVNALSTKMTAEDLNHVVVQSLAGIMLAKSESVDDLQELDNMLTSAERLSGFRRKKLTIIPLIESAKGVLNAHDIAKGSKRVIALAFGAGDYYRDLGRNVTSLSPEQTELLYARSRIVNCCVAASIQPIDAPYFGLLTDKAGFREEVKLGVRLGFKGKLLVHPTQIEPTNDLFSPLKDETKYALELVKAFKEAQKTGLGAVSFDGKMVDYMHYQQAKELIALSRAVSKRKALTKRKPHVTLDHFFTHG